MEKVEVLNIGPKEAAEMIKMNTENFRKVDHATVDKYAKEMARGEWHFNGETIKIDNNVLLDGQHRLLAILKSGSTIKTIVVTGVDNGSFSTIDRGKGRTIAQWCSYNGLRHANTVAAAAKLCVGYNKGLWPNMSIQPSEVLDSEIMDFITINSYTLQESSSLAVKANNVSPGSTLSAILHIGCGGKNPKDVEVANWFIKALASGENLDNSDAVFHYRNRVLNQTQSKQTSLYMKRMLLTIAWNKTVQGELCKSLLLRMTGPRKQLPPSSIIKVSEEV